MNGWARGERTKDADAGSPEGPSSLRRLGVCDATRPTPSADLAQSGPLGDPCPCDGSLLLARPPGRRPAGAGADPQPAMFALVCALWAALWGTRFDASPRQHVSRTLSKKYHCSSGWCSSHRSCSCWPRSSPMPLSSWSFAGRTLQGILQCHDGGLSAAVAAVVFREILGAHSPVGFRGWAAGAVAPCAAVITMTVTVSIFRELCGQTTQRRTGPQITDQCHAHGVEHLPGIRRTRRRLVRPLGGGPGRFWWRFCSSSHTEASRDCRFASPRSSACTTSAGHWAPPASNRRR